MKKYVLCTLILLVMSISGCNKTLSENNENVKGTTKTYEYQVVSVYPYIKITSTNFGAVSNQELVYYFTYIGDDGQLHEFEDFEHTEYGSNKLCIGEENKYVITEDFDIHRYLYLTQETLKELSIIQNKF